MDITKSYIFERKPVSPLGPGPSDLPPLMVTRPGAPEREFEASTNVHSSH